VPDGALQLVNLAALPAARDRYLVETGPLLHTLTTERDLVAPESAVAPRAGLLPGGWPAFERALQARTRPASRPLAERAGGGGPASASVGARFPPLPGAGEEAIEIAKIWRDAASTGDRGDVVCLTGEHATEAAIKQVAPGRRVLHVATHSFRLRAPGG